MSTQDFHDGQHGIEEGYELSQEDDLAGTIETKMDYEDKVFFAKITLRAARHCRNGKDFNDLFRWWESFIVTDPQLSLAL